jgi:hypothetical protein
MMTFEQFFLKKKIDLAALAQNKPDLFLEFKSHYAQMGEKSFDHTKKYWFNQLRLSNKLSEEDESRLKSLLYPPKEVIAAKEEAPSASTEITNTKPPGFKPRFKAPINPQSDVIKKEDDLAETPKLATGFKPRFKAAAIPVKQEEPEQLEIEEEQTFSEAPKPASGFKPRFKAAATPAKQEESLPLKEEEIKEEPKKPTGFKPRFKAGSTPAKQEDKED